MKQAWDDLKSFATVFTLILLAVIIIANLFGYNLDKEILLLFTNIITGIMTYYFARNKKNNDGSNDDESI